ARAGLRLRPAALGADAAPRRELLALLHEGNDSFLFLDYDMWSDLDRVYVIDPPPDEDEIDESVRLADTWALSQVAPDVLQAFHRFEPSPTDLRRVLELEAAGSNVTEAACAVASNVARFEFWFDSKLKYDTSYLLDVFLCKSDPDKKEIAEVIPKIIKTVASQTKLSFEFNVSVFDVDCEDENSLMRKYIERAQSAHWARA
ncbi:uncharacterized protein LOC114363616, partial [Ostrinia furnacalis]|uniref:uncharacterized protein LOC114363616 n=1 Tax=Ostrinia furnacalis TaxID=93504 RepID=UPI001038F975